MTQVLTGGCNCGAVRFEIEAPLAFATYCHCQRCQRRTGSATSAQAVVRPGTFRLLSGADALKGWKPEGGREKFFCRGCGSAIYSGDIEKQDPLAVRLGVFDKDPGVRPEKRAFTDYAAPWEPIPDDGLPRYPEAIVRPQ